MKSFQDECLQFAQEAATRLSELPNTSNVTGGGASLSSNSWQESLKKFAEFISKPENRATALKVLWLISLVIVVVVTAVAFALCKALFANYVIGSYFAAVLWGLFVGGCLFLFVAPKLITAAFGSLIGTSISETGTASGLITKTTEAITKLATDIGTIRPTPPPAGTEPTADPVIFNTILIFVIVLMLCCAPAFFTKDD